MNPSSIPIVELLPHGPEMTVIDQLVEYDPRKSVAIVDVHPGAAFFDETGVPAWVGIEYMAQTVAAHVGFSARLRGEPVAIGFLLGTRRYESTLAVFPDGARLTITVEPALVDASVAAFKCSIETNEVVATAVVSTYQPSAATLERMREESNSL
jgi:predicted hotdog family 3-hydroxylacyl-ACP dehydratase